MDKTAISEAIKTVLGAVSEADGRDMVGQRKPKAVSVEVEAKPAKCQACEDGTCGDPEHASEEDLASMLGG